MNNLNTSILILLIVLILAVFQDIKFYKIKNITIIVGLFLGIVLNIFLKLKFTTKNEIISKVICILVLIFCYLIKAIGAGDVKLFIVCAFFVDEVIFINIIIQSFLIGAIISIVKILNEKRINEIYLKINLIIRDILEGRVDRIDIDKTKKENIIHFSIPILLATIASTFININLI